MQNPVVQHKPLVRKAKGAGLKLETVDDSVRSLGDCTLRRGSFSIFTTDSRVVKPDSPEL